MHDCSAASHVFSINTSGHKSVMVQDLHRHVPQACPLRRTAALLMVPGHRKTNTLKCWRCNIEEPCSSSATCSLHHWQDARCSLEWDLHQRTASRLKSAVCARALPMKRSCIWSQKIMERWRTLLLSRTLVKRSSMKVLACSACRRLEYRAQHACLPHMHVALAQGLRRQRVEVVLLAELRGKLHTFSSGCSPWSSETVKLRLYDSCRWGTTCTRCTMSPVAVHRQMRGAFCKGILELRMDCQVGPHRVSGRALHAADD